MRILIADDSVTMRRIIIATLGAINGMEFEEVSDGEAAAAAAAAKSFDLILMDWNMPKMNGLEAVVAIRAAGNAVPIFMVTTEAEKTRIMEALKAGANNYVVKPFKKETMIEKVKSIGAAA